MHDISVVSPSLMYHLDQLTIQNQNLTEAKLLERAGIALTNTLIETLKFNQKNNHFLCVIGPGLNGGDALIMARELSKIGHKTTIFVASKTVHKLSEILLKKLRKTHTVIEEFEMFNEHLDSAQYVIDGLFGIGLNKAVKEPFSSIIEVINQSNKYVISIDVPSGINGVSGLKMNHAVNADLTLVIGHFKTGNLLQDAPDYHGKKTRVDIGLEPLENSYQWVVHAGHFKHIKMTRRHNTHKYHYGALLTIGGAHGMMGAPYLSALAALRTGVGLSVVMHHHEDYHERFKNDPEIMAFKYFNIHDLSEHLIKKNAIVFGPGLGKNQPENEQILKFLLDTSRPLVIDADGLYYLKKYLNYPMNPQVILTPHMGEMAQLFDVTVDTVSADPMHYVKQLTDKGFTVLLKGPTSIIAHKHHVYFSSCATPALATAGSGDVLSGMIGALLARKIMPLDAVNFAVYLHGQVGITASIKEGVESVIASDLIRYLPTVLTRFNIGKD